MQVGSTSNFSVVNSSMKLNCPCTKERRSQTSVSGNVRSEAVNIWVCLLSSLQQICSSTQMTWMLFVLVSSTETGWGIDPSHVVAWFAVTHAVFLLRPLLMFSVYSKHIGMINDDGFPLSWPEILPEAHTFAFSTMCNSCVDVCGSRPFHFIVTVHHTYNYMSVSSLVTSHISQDF